MDLKSLTDDVLYETYRTEKLSRMVHADHTDDSILPEDLATQSVRLKEEQLRREEEKVSAQTFSALRSLVVDTCFCLTASRDRAQGSTRDQREAARAPCQGRVAPQPGNQARGARLTGRVLDKLPFRYPVCGCVWLHLGQGYTKVTNRCALSRLLRPYDAYITSIQTLSSGLCLSFALYLYLDTLLLLAHLFLPFLLPVSRNRTMLFC
jgi:hypothetical protein